MPFYEEYSKWIFMPFVVHRRGPTINLLKKKKSPEKVYSYCRVSHPKQQSNRRKEVSNTINLFG